MPLSKEEGGSNLRIVPVSGVEERRGAGRTGGWGSVAGGQEVRLEVFSSRGIRIGLGDVRTFKLVPVPLGRVHLRPGTASHMARLQQSGNT